MKIKIDTDKISQLTTLTLSGELDFNELVAFIDMRQDILSFYPFLQNYKINVISNIDPGYSRPEI